MNSEAPRILRLVSLCQRLNADEYPEIVNLATRIALYSKPKTRKKATMKKAIKEALTDRKHFDSLHSEVPVRCAWCEETYMQEDESKHLETCSVFSTLPVSQIAPDGRTFVTLPGTDILVERKRKH